MYKDIFKTTYSMSVATKNNIPTRISVVLVKTIIIFRLLQTIQAVSFAYL